jgi:hypothetical protein
VKSSKPIKGLAEAANDFGQTQAAERANSSLVEASRRRAERQVARWVDLALSRARQQPPEFGEAHKLLEEAKRIAPEALEILAAKKEIDRLASLHQAAVHLANEDYQNALPLLLPGALWDADCREMWHRTAKSEVLQKAPFPAKHEPMLAKLDAIKLALASQNQPDLVPLIKDLCRDIPKFQAGLLLLDAWKESSGGATLSEAPPSPAPPRPAPAPPEDSHAKDKPGLLGRLGRFFGFNRLTKKT